MTASRDRRTSKDRKASLDAFLASGITPGNHTCRTCVLGEDVKEAIAKYVITKKAGEHQISMNAFWVHLKDVWGYQYKVGALRNHIINCLNVEEQETAK